MKSSRLLIFTLVSVAAGLFAALLVLSLVSDPDPRPNPNVARSTNSGVQSGPASYASAVQAATPSVVNIYTSKVTFERRTTIFDDPVFQRFFGDRFAFQPEEKRQTSLGSGVIINDQGFILTNHHVIKGADEIRVVLANGDTFAAEIAGTDPDTDLAVIKSEQTNLPAITVGDSQHLRVGDVVLAIGNPFGVGQTVTMGIVSATGRNQLGINTFENFIQTDAAINPGNSGGALINAYGELVGINTAIFSKTGGSDGIGFAIPVALAKGVMDQILKQGRVVRGWLGIAGQDITPELAEAFSLPDMRGGVLVSGVLEGGPADQAGIEPGDIITRIDNRVPGSVFDILSIISALPPGTKIEVRGLRGNKSIKLEAVVSERPKIQMNDG
ncbi:MAG: trypsin-like peptidase domain-containing protein [Gammaproteobacteria bacterium]|nr:trypsin-like peptidase domain-containing protein [Gammaproteobacteria bacterium]MCB1902708.1 trypsin-like peptidase domain-containing protein [Gammaproteobacteria bacterium]